jgi:hypothetical protein
MPSVLPLPIGKHVVYLCGVKDVERLTSLSFLAEKSIPYRYPRSPSWKSEAPLLIDLWDIKPLASFS